MEEIKNKNIKVNKSKNVQESKKMAKVEKNKQASNNKNKSKKIENNKLINELWSFYNENIKKTHIVLYIIAIIIFAVCLTSMLIIGTRNVSIVDQIPKSHITVAIKDRALMGILTVFAGMVPYVYLPIWIILILPMNIIGILNTKVTFAFFIASIFTTIQLFLFSLLAALGKYLCTCKTKHYKYSLKSGYLVEDVKITAYQMTKNDEKREKAEKKKMEKEIKRQELNVKIQYKEMIIITLGTVILSFIIALITGV